MKSKEEERSQFQLPGLRYAEKMNANTKIVLPNSG